MTEETTYLIEFKNGKKQKITVPSDWKVTFGPAARGANSDKRKTFDMPLALRFYEDEKKQRAIFTDVQSFRDMSIKIEEEKISIQEKDGYLECDGVKKATIFQAQTKEWINPDEQAKKFPVALPSDKDIFGDEEDLDDADD
jgi:hypothetical protein